MKVWIVRDNDLSFCDSIFVWFKEPYKCEYDVDILNKNIILYGYKTGPGKYDFASFGHEYLLFTKNIVSFEEIFGFVPEKGSCEEINLNLERTKK